MPDLTPVAHSVVQASYLADRVAELYDLGGEAWAQLLYRGMNDVYLVRAGETRLALRVWRASWRAMDEVAYELQLLDYLRQAEFPCSAGLKTRSGESFFVLQSPEGQRPAALYDWAPGAKFGDALSTAGARRIGALFARFHGLGLQFRPTLSRANFGLPRLDEALAALGELLWDRPEELARYIALAPRLSDRLARLGGEALPTGPCHCDFHPSNVHVAADGRITLLDFDQCGDDFWMQDVQNFVFGNAFYGFPIEIGEAFCQGYETVRPFTEVERAQAPLFYMAKIFRLLLGIALNVNSVGRATLRFRGLDWFASEIDRLARALDLD